MSEIAQRLLAGSKKYSSTSSKNTRTPSDAKWIPRCPNDTPDEQKRPIIIAFGNAAFSGTMKGKVAAPCKAILKALKQKAQNRRVKFSVNDLLLTTRTGTYLCVHGR